MATFPAGSTTIPFSTNPDPKPASASTGDQVVNVNNPSFAALPGVGAGGVVTQGTFLFIRTLGTMQVRTTTYNAGGMSRPSRSSTASRPWSSTLGPTWSCSRFSVTAK